MKQFNLVLTSLQSSSLKGFEATSQLPKVAPKFNLFVVLEISIKAISGKFFAITNQKKFIQLEFAKRLKIDAWPPILK